MENELKDTILTLAGLLNQAKHMYQALQREVEELRTYKDSKEIPF